MIAMGLIGSKPLASLSSGLLARKGQAKPAMRPQTFGPAASLEDLGWNDMGQPAISPPADPVPLPPVLVERDALAAKIVAPECEPKPKPKPEPKAETPVTPATVARIGRESAVQAARGKAAFTLRLDPARHVRLRLASAVANRSAQALVVQALDQLLATMPEIEALVARLPVKEATR